MYRRRSTGPASPSKGAYTASVGRWEDRLQIRIHSFAGTITQTDFYGREWHQVPNGVVKLIN
jgi:hypothetical protein